MKPLLLIALSMSLASEYPQSTIREEQEVVVDGVKETWQLRWTKPPHPACIADDPGAFECPCQGFAYGESGPLEVVRIRQGRQIDRMPIRASLFQVQGDEIMLQRWPTEENDILVRRWRPADGDLATPDTPGLQEMMAARPPVQIMQFADYDHDGEKTEFFLQTSATPCGRTSGIVIGISKNDPTLHAFGTTTNRLQPLYLPRQMWEALSTATRTIETIETHCGEPGAQNETTLRLGWNLSGITVEPREWTCPGGFKSGRLVL